MLDLLDIQITKENAYCLISTSGITVPAFSVLTLSAWNPEFHQLQMVS